MFFHESLPIGTIIDSGVRKYEIKSVLGKGGFGITYLATSTVYVDNIPLEGQFAIKEHFISSMNERQGVSVSISNVNNTDEIKESIDSFLVEAQRLKKLSLNHSGKLFYPIAKAIGYLHDNRVTHLDIKPDNILIRENSEPVVIDFGLSKHYSSKGTPTSTIKAAGCSLGYSPMEQYAGLTTFTPEADIYALGATLLYMLAGKDPIISTEINEDIIRRSIPKYVSNQTKDAIVHAMEKLKDNRPTSVKDFVCEMNSGRSERNKDSNGVIDGDGQDSEKDVIIPHDSENHRTKKIHGYSKITHGFSKKWGIGVLACSLIALMAILYFMIPRNKFKVDVDSDASIVYISYKDENNFSGGFAYDLSNVDNPGEGISGYSKTARCQFSTKPLLKGKYALTVNYKGMKEEFEVGIKN